MAERQRLGTEYRNARSSRRLLSDVTQVSAGIGVERLEEDKMLAAAIDNFFSMLICEKDAGFTERVVANVQCVIDLNFYLAPYAKKTCGISDDVKIIDDLCMHWDSESPRLGELCEGPPVFTPVVSIPESDESGLIPDCSDLSRWCFRGNDGHQPVSPHLYLSAGSKDWICRGRPTSGWVSGCGKLFWEFVPEPLLNATVNTDDQKDGSYEKIVNNNTTDSNEKVSFAETFLHEWFLNEEQAHRGQQAVRNNDDQLNKDGDEADAETQWVYSRLHGYRIPQPTVRDTSSAYRKILRDIRGDNAANGAASLAEVTDGRQIATELVTAADLSADPLVIHTRLEELASVEQFLPLRIQAEGQDKLIELQPERVIFADDIRANVLVVSSKSLLARLLIRCLEALGITFINCWAVPLSGLPSHAAQQGALQAPDSVLSISNGICSLPNIEVSEANKMDNIMSRLFGYLEGSLFEGKLLELICVRLLTK